ncbi:putative cytochrome C-type heme lyase [Toxoplasma gondii TgCatPRC2]|uniref:Holocytochrome c-type synthase n=12 Tax=Toxoplasma gondii TaxID=5811 RepID=B9PY27_TOXGV|nr:cytochrome C-type heme lyase, putative [Toxoplasma gondii ME49]EPR57643.1 putative cytochrome C-type heme lyase [Toxoplasma gondii GT1]ESS29236.1 putative cytochrome C-type heme lyase [Toxoplasma gondii VEG]KAF4646083.1 putative cytochrome C-type heme lyase [Toxoplasma gondii]KYK65969.1 putative cytochrome C-type heme lyase [Toxoplasma gondii TgCatPRC2]PUA86921.1 putative cytochrome C-type heme lyase [Toxoplasma gondii TgCATBr9]RQX68753.1 putative cytochrome C-type heme lyase [Toxoplasma g|eukprot:XP_002370141.1 cytochrome C-type heme lyase, putative [Toxoplasma gondii ME49]
MATAATCPLGSTCPIPSSSFSSSSSSSPVSSSEASSSCPARSLPVSAPSSCAASCAPGAASTCTGSPSGRKCVVASALSTVLATPALLFPSLKPPQLSADHKSPSFASARQRLFRFAPSPSPAPPHPSLVSPTHAFRGTDSQRPVSAAAASTAVLPARALGSAAGNDACPFRGQRDMQREDSGFAARLVQRRSGSSPSEDLPDATTHEVHEEINPRNMMPEISNAPQQDPDDLALSTHRRVSTIPKTGEDATWIYPSPLQFHRAMKKKNKEPPPADAMETTVYVHDVVNERTWKNILHWENALHKECEKPTLSRFVGRSSDYTPTARLRQYFSYMGLPFDRHDWYVDRCGETVRYIVDYYDDPQATDNIQVFIHTRPAWFDSWQNFSDNVRHFVSSFFA